jgi:hypothetical protein
MGVDQVQKLEETALQEIVAAGESGNFDDIELLRVKYLGRKGALTTILRGLG